MNKTLLISAAVSAFIGAGTIAKANHKEHCMKDGKEVAGVEQPACEADGGKWEKAACKGKDHCKGKDGCKGKDHCKGKKKH